MPSMIVNGLNTNYQLLPAAAQAEHSEPQHVVFIHGLGTDSLASFYLTLAPPVAAAGINVISYDLRGHGKTDRPDRGYRLQDFVDDLVDLLTQLGIKEPVHLVGNSFGGTIAYAVAWQHPELVRSIVCIESEPPTAAWAEKMKNILAATMEFLQIEDSYDWIEANFSAHHRRLARLAGQRITSTSMAEEVPLGPIMTIEQVSEITCPVLSLLGSHGYQADDLDALTSLLPRGEKYVFDGQGHSVLVEQHREVRELLISWISRHATESV